MSNTDTSWFCSVLFNHIYSDAEGAWRTCCYEQRGLPGCGESTVYNTTPLQHFLSDKMNEYRRMTLNGEVPDVCTKCKRYEDEGIKSYRQIKNKNAHEVSEIVEHFKKTGEFKMIGRFLRIKVKIFGNYCNLTCFMCHPQNSSSRQSEFVKMTKKYDYDFLGKWGQPKSGLPSFETTLKYEEVIKEIESLAPHILDLQILGGEPLMMKNHYDLLDSLIKSGHSKEIGLIYVTNLTKLQHGNRNFLHYIDKFKSNSFAISIDGIDKRGEWIRNGLKFNEFIENLRIMKQSAERIQLAFTASNLSILYATEMYDYFTFEEGIEPVMDENIVTSPRMLDPRHLPDYLKEKLINDFENHAHSHQFKGLIQTLKHPRSDSKHRQGMKYIKTLNDFRKTNVGELFPELKDEIEAAEMDFYNDPEYYLREMG